MNERLRHRLELRRSNASSPHRNRYRERVLGQDPTEALNEVQQGLIDYEEEYELYEPYEDQ